ncbi:LecA/PA-IL family lectin [Enterobacter cloacae]
MNSSAVWSGEVDAKSPEGTRTGIVLKAGDRFSAGARGWVKRGKEEYTLAGPQGVAGNSDSAVVLKGRIGDTEFVVGNYLIDFPAPAEGELTFFVSDGKGKYIDNSGVFQVQVFRPRSETSRFEDLTDFSGDNWNGWKTGEATTRAALADARCRVLQLMTYPGEKNAGTVVSKTLKGLKAGQHYLFTIQAARIIGKYKEPRLFLRVNNQDITPVTVLSEAGKWVTLEGKFTADNDTATCSVVSHESDSMGNDYQIKVLRISG